MPRPAPDAPAAVPPDERLSSPERVAAGITRGLLRREYAVGQRLVEADLTARLGVSRSTVREALKILASRGVVELVPHRGAVIRGLSLAEVDSLLAVLEVLTGLAARLAAQRIGLEGNRARFEQAAQALVEARAPRHPERHLEDRARFYQAMFEVAASDELNRAMPTWRAHLLRSQFQDLLAAGDLRAMVGEYRRITAAILAGDPERAERHTRAHLQHSRARVLPHLR